MSNVAYEIPTSPQPQTFSISLNGVSYQLTLTWCDPASCWLLEIDDANGNQIVAGIPLVTGVDLLAQYEHLGIGGQLFAQTDGDPGAPPTFDNLGTTGHLYFVVPA
jgi:Domain of unknown function (DUF6983)